MRKPGPNCQVVVAYTGAVAPEAIEAVGLMAEDRRDVGLLAITSADRLNAGWTAAQRARERGLVHARSHIERLLADVPPHCGIVTVLDGHPATLGMARRRCRPPRRARSASSISARPARSPSSIGTTASTPTRSLRPRRRLRPAARSAISRRCPEPAATSCRYRTARRDSEDDDPDDDRANDDGNRVDQCLVGRRPHQRRQCRCTADRDCTDRELPGTPAPE